MALTLAWQYLGGQIRATDGRDERQVEWPPHPGRVWLALASRWFLDGESPSGKVALETLRQSPEPRLWIPAVTGLARRPVGVYVPVNDTAAGNTPFGHLPVGRIRQERFFPSLHVGEDAVCALHWPELTLPDDLFAALEALVGGMFYLGQSTSLIRAWLWPDAVPPPGTMVLDTLADTTGPVWHLRGFSCGFSLAELARWHAAGRSPIPRGWVRYGLRERVPSSALRVMDASSAVAPGRETETTLSVVRGSGAMAIAVEEAKGLHGEMTPGADTAAPPRPVPTPWDPDLTFFLQVGGPPVPVTSILHVVRGLRQEMARRCELPLPSWMTGHDDDGSPVRRNTWYLGIFPVAHLGAEAANGRLVGLALARPRALPREEWEKRLYPILSPVRVPVVLPDGEMRGARIVVESATRPLSGAFHSWLWTGGDMGSCVWATITPMVLDLSVSPSPSHVFQEKLIRSIRYSCRLAGLPAPVEVIARRAPWWLGSFPSRARDLGERGFPPDCRFGREKLPRLHVWLRFPVPVRGPLALGRQRFQGYGSFWALPAAAKVPEFAERVMLRFQRDMSPPAVYVGPSHAF